MSNAALTKAIDAAGGQSALATVLGVRQSHVWFWLKRSKLGVPAERVLDVERITGIPRHELRPDIYPPPPQAPADAPAEMREAS